MDNLRRLGSSFSIRIPPDDDGFTGRECPSSECLGYFKIEFGTGLKGEDLPCHCPYCGETAPHDQYWTPAQIEYAKSAALRKVQDAIHQDLKKLEFDYRPSGGFGIGLSMKVKPGSLPPIHYYREKRLETEVLCDHCTLRYSVYGVFAFCPDCGRHNSLQILRKNFEVIEKMLDLAAGLDGELAEKLIENALEDCVSSFDGFGREIVRVLWREAATLAEAEKVSFQNLDSARRNLKKLFKLDLGGGLTAEEWQAAVRGFQKRHVLSHKMGVADAEYIRKSGDVEAVIGRKVVVNVEEVRELAQIIGKLAGDMVTRVRRAEGS